MSDAVETVERFYGWKPDLPDWRDSDYAMAPPGSAFVPVQPLPLTVRLDHMPFMPDVYDQLQLGSCTANALAAAVEYDLREQDLTDFVPSRMFIYYNERVIERSVDEDAGAMIRDGAKTLHHQGVCSETEWPYDVVTFRVRPSAAAYANALNTRSVAYGRVARRSMQRVLAGGVPFTIGFTVYESFNTIGDDGIMPMPDGGILGGHAVLVCGYATIGGRLYYRVRNSWGRSWGNDGYFWMPAEYLMNTRLSQDFWAIDSVS